MSQQPVRLVTGGQAESLDREARDAARPFIRGGFLVVAVAVLGFAAWSALAPLSAAIIAPGVVKVELNRKTVQHQEGGIVKEILVKDGDHVRAGQPLVVLEDERVSASVEVLRGQIDAERAKMARLEAERQYLPTLTFPADLQAHAAGNPKLAEFLASEAGFFKAKRNALEDQQRLLRNQVGEGKERVAALEQEAKAEGRSIGLMEEELAANERLVEQNFVQKTRLLALKRSVAEYEARYGEHMADMAEGKQRISELELRIVNLRNSYIQQAADELTATRNRLFDLQERLRPSLDAQERQKIVAPVAGEVVDNKVHTVGGVIGPREPVMDIVPFDNPLIVEAQVSVDDIDELHLGMEADVRLTAYRRRTTAMVYGKVSYVSADRLVDRASGRPYYTAHVDVDPKSLAEAGEGIKLSAGMPAEVYIRTRERTALDYLLEPVTDTLRRSMREP